MSPCLESKACTGNRKAPALSCFACQLLLQVTCVSPRLHTLLGCLPDLRFLFPCINVTTMHICCMRKLQFFRNWPRKTTCMRTNSSQSAERTSLRPAFAGSLFGGLVLWAIIPLGELACLVPAASCKPCPFLLAALSASWATSQLASSGRTLWIALLLEAIAPVLTGG